MLEKRVCDQKESEYEQKKDGVLERKYNDGRSGDMGRRKNTEMKYVETLKKTVLIFVMLTAVMRRKEKGAGGWR